MKLVVEALLVIYLFYLGSELILIDIRKPCRSSTCLVRYCRFTSSRAFQAGPLPAEVYERADHHRNAAYTQQGQLVISPLWAEASIRDSKETHKHRQQASFLDNASLGFPLSLAAMFFQLNDQPFGMPLSLP
jgi:hypothetical protein